MKHIDLQFLIIKLNNVKMFTNGGNTSNYVSCSNCLNTMMEPSAANIQVKTKI